MIRQQKGDDVSAEAPVGKGAPVPAVFIDDEARVRYAFCRLPEQFCRVEAVATPADHERRCGDTAESVSEIESILGPDGRDHVRGVPPAPYKQWPGQPQQPPGDPLTETRLRDIGSLHHGESAPVARS